MRQKLTLGHRPPVDHVRSQSTWAILLLAYRAYICGERGDASEREERGLYAHPSEGPRDALEWQIDQGIVAAQLICHMAPYASCHQVSCY